MVGKKFLCPRCGMEGYEYVNIVRGRRYKMVSHYLGGGKRKYCYIGPIDGYVHGAGLHGISIGHAFSLENKIRMLEDLVNNIVEQCNNGKCSVDHRMEVIAILWQGLRNLGVELEIPKDYGMNIETFKQKAIESIVKWIAEKLSGKVS